MDQACSSLRRAIGKRCSRDLQRRRSCLSVQTTGAMKLKEARASLSLSGRRLHQRHRGSRGASTEGGTPFLDVFSAQTITSSEEKASRLALTADRFIGFGDAATNLNDCSCSVPSGDGLRSSDYGGGIASTPATAHHSWRLQMQCARHRQPGNNEGQNNGATTIVSTTSVSAMPLDGNGNDS